MLSAKSLGHKFCIDKLPVIYFIYFLSSAISWLKIRTSLKSNIKSNVHLLNKEHSKKYKSSAQNPEENHKFTNTYLSLTDLDT